MARGACVFNGYLSGGGVHSLGIPVNQYETMAPYHYSLTRVEKAREPFIAVQTESENGRMEAWRIAQQDSDDPEFLFRQYDVTGASHDTSYSYVDYYQNDPDLVRINHLPFYMGKNEEGNDYPSQILFAAAFRNLFTWVRTGAAPAHCDRIAIDSDGENKKDAFGNTIGGLRTCLLDYPTGRYSNTSDIEKGRISWILNRKRKDCSVISRRFRKNDKRAVRNIGTLPGNGGEKHERAGNERLCLPRGCGGAG